MILLRLLICLILYYSPFVLFVAASRNKDNALWLLFPIYGTIPAVLGALLLFIPLENYLIAHALGHLNNVAIPVAGSLLIVIFMFIAATLSGNLPRYLSRICKEGRHILGPMLFWSLLGTIWGAVWRLSHWLLVVLDFTSNT
jgi:hypothetical protein